MLCMCGAAIHPGAGCWVCGANAIPAVALACAVCGAALANRGVGRRSQYCPACAVERKREYQREYQREYRQRPEAREYKREYRQRPEAREYQREYRRRPEVRERKREYRRYVAHGIDARPPDTTRQALITIRAAVHPTSEVATVIEEGLANV